MSQAKQFATIERIAIGGVSETMAPLGLHVYADHFLKAALALPQPAVKFEPVRPYLVCHAIELALKAFLSLQGRSLLELADGQYGHKLTTILRAAEDAGLSSLVALSAEHREAICAAELYYSGKVFEYPAVGEALSAYPSMPSLDTLLQGATLLVASLAKPCSEAR